MKKTPKNPIAKIADRLVKRQLRPVFSLIRRFRSRIIYGLYRFLPRSLRSSMPMLAKQANKYARQKLKERQQSNKETSEPLPELDLEEITQKRVRLLPSTSTDYSQYSCVTEDPLACVSAVAKIRHCQKCRFPAILPVHSEIVGQKGRYRVTGFLGRRGRGRIYRGIRVDNEAEVTIKEYLLPLRHFNREEQRYTHNAFKNQGNIELVDGRQQDFRLPLRADLISPPPQDLQSRTQNLSQNKPLGDRERCYLVTPGDREQLTTLRAYLIFHGAMSATEVYRVLNQVLQSLESLHNQKFRLPTGQIESQIPHGNLSLESVLIATDPRPYLEQAQFQIYLTDLALWENLFAPPPRLSQLHSIEQDLTALGYLGFYLLKGQSVNENGYPLSPHNRFNWEKIEPQLKQYIDRLLAIDTPFTDAFDARQALLKLNLEQAEPKIAAVDIATVEPSKPQKYPWRSLLMIALAIFLSSLGYWWWYSQRQPSLANAGEPSICCISDVAGIPQGTFNYTAEKGGIWHYVWQQKNLVAKNITLKTKLAAKTPQLKLKYQPQTNEATAISNVEAGTADFAVVNSVSDIDSSLTADTFAYDGLSFFVAFSQDRNTQDLLDSLKGKISLEQLRQLYTGKITNWQQLGGADLPVKLYVPDSDSAIALFEQQVLLNPSQVETFRYLLNTDKLDEQPITRLPILPMLRRILPEFENERIGSIGFASLARVFNQCSVYPLALVDDRGKSNQALLQSNLEPINPKLDLCREKGSYIRDRQLFQTNRYPLTYSLAVVYPRDNSLTPAGVKFAEILKTDESQKLLSKAGLIPLHD